MKKHLFAAMAFLSLAALACSFSQVTDWVSPVSSLHTEATAVALSGEIPTQPANTNQVLPAGCGDGTCDEAENPQDCPIDCAEASSATVVAPQAAAPFDEGPDPNSYWIQNPTSGARLFVQVVYPADWNEQRLHTLVLVPGGTGTSDLKKARRLADQGFTVIFFDPDGRGRSQGQEDLDGTIHQDGLAAVLRAAAAFPGVDPKKIGLVSYSYGVTMASGTLARYPDLPVRFFIDWEGPADRNDTTTGCQTNKQIAWPNCDDQAAWAQREALTFIAQVKVPYLRLQSEKDHVQPDVSHAVNMVNAAIAGVSPWVRLNDLLLNQTYDLNNPPGMLPEKSDSNLDLLIGHFAGELFSI
jgi:pimeloyl-ACP methyl ester carboxylesterase